MPPLVLSQSRTYAISTHLQAAPQIQIVPILKLVTSFLAILLHIVVMDPQEILFCVYLTQIVLLGIVGITYAKNGLRRLELPASAMRNVLILTVPK